MGSNNHRTSRKVRVTSFHVLYSRIKKKKCRSFTTENTMYGIENFEDSLESFDEGTDLTDNVFDSVQRIISDNLLVSE